MEWILNCIITAMPVVIGPILNVTILGRKEVKKVFKKPIDFGKNFIDGKRIFGDNKTWKGLILSILFCILASIIWGLICKYVQPISNRNWFYINHENTIMFNILIGALLGLSYSLFELPNSFLKRRFDIAPGKSSNVKGEKRFIFLILDQFDSEIGTMLVIWYFANLSLLEYLQCVLLAGFLHYVIVKIMCYFRLKESV